MTPRKSADQIRINALKVNQWLKEWDLVEYDSKSHRRQPDPFFYIFSIPASHLKALSGIYRREVKEVVPRSEDLGIQRRHDEKRSEVIREFSQYGYPWSELSDSERASGMHDDLRKPGWLPTSIVVNILKPEDTRSGHRVVPGDLVNVENSRNEPPLIVLPEDFSGADWRPSALHPIEVIDGQHRLWAFEDYPLGDEFYLPVVAFHGLDISWQAYLFWIINIRPKRINASLAYDLYPLLRTESWLQHYKGHPIYRETRAQELTEALWSYPDSAWYKRINMLGEPGLRRKMVSQAAWIRSLMATFIKSFKGPGVSIGGLFGAPVREDEPVIPWSRAQQASFLILVWQEIRDAVRKQNQKWASSLRENNSHPQEGEIEDPAFSGRHTLLNTDQGVRGILYIANDLCYVRASELRLTEWATDDLVTAPSQEKIAGNIQKLKKEPVHKFVRQIANGLAKYDWRSSSAPGLSEDEKTAKLAFRGSGGYKELRRQLLIALTKESQPVGSTAEKVLLLLDFD